MGSFSKDSGGVKRRFPGGFKGAFSSSHGLFHTIAKVFSEICEQPNKSKKSANDTYLKRTDLVFKTKNLIL
jgi:hypothetical protein